MNQIVRNAGLAGGDSDEVLRDWWEVKVQNFYGPKGVELWDVENSINEAKGFH